MRISRVLSRFLLIGCIVGAAIPCAFGQGGGGGPGGGVTPGGGRGGFGSVGGGMAYLLGIAEVRTELKMDEPTTKEFEAVAKELRDEAMASFGGGRGAGGGGGPGGGGTPPDFAKIRETMPAMQEKIAAMQVKSEAKIAEILDPDQFDRLIGLFIQREGTRTLSSKTISTRLNITKDQKDKIAEVEKASQEEMMAMFGGARGGAGGGGDFREKMDKMRKDSEEKVNAVLTTAQKDEMEKLKGAKFEFPAAQRRGGRGANPS